MRKVIFHSLWILLTLSILILSWTCDTRTPTSPEYDYVISLTHDSSEDETFADYGVTTVTLTAELKDDAGQFLSNKIITFLYNNLDESQTLGEIEQLDTQTDANGKMRIKYKDNGQSGNIEVTAKYEDEVGNIAETTDTLLIIPIEGKVQTITLISDVSDNIVLVSDSNLDSTYTTMFSAFVRDSLGFAVENVKVNFSNLTAFGALVVPNDVLTDEIGKCQVALSTTAMDLGVAEIKAYITKEELERVMALPDNTHYFSDLELNRGSTEISDTVSVEFKLNEYDYEISLTHDSSEDETFADYGLTTVTLTAELKDDAGQFLSNKTIIFMHNNLDESQTLGEIEQLDTQTDENGKMRIKYKDNGQSGNIEITAKYEDEVGNIAETTDTLLISPIEGKVQTITLISDDSDNIVLVSDSNLDSTYTTMFSAFVRDSIGYAVENVKVNFSNLTAFGALVVPNDVLTDEIGKCQVALSTTAMDLGVAEIKAYITKEEIEISDTVSVEFKLNSQSNSSLTLESDHYYLPYDDLGQLDGVTAHITATMVDSLGDIPDENTVIHFQSMKDSSGILIPFGSIDPYSFFSDEGTASATFNMSGTSGLAYIIGNSQGLKDTIHISVNPSYAVTMEIIPAYPNEIQVTGGGGQESTDISVVIKDGYGNPVGQAYQVRFEILPPYPLDGMYPNGDGNFTNDINFNGLETDPTTIAIVESSNGTASVSLNSGNRPGSVNIQAALFEADETDYSLDNAISIAEDAMATIVTGAAEYGEINFSYVDINAIGGGAYQMPIAISIWDEHSNPVSDCTNVWVSISEISGVYNETNTYVIGDKSYWGTTEADSLVYVSLVDDNTGNSPTDSDYWSEAQQPAFIIGEAKTGNANPVDGLSYPGIAWTIATYSSASMFADVVVKAQTFSGDNEYLILDSRYNHNGEPTTLPFQPGELTANTDFAFWDYSTFPNQDDNGVTYTGDITISVSLMDYYQYQIDNGTVQLLASGAEILTDNPAITDPSGQATWTIRYPRDLLSEQNPEDCPTGNPSSCDLCEYEDFTSSILVTLTDPINTTSNQIEITLVRSGDDDCD